MKTEEIINLILNEVEHAENKHPQWPVDILHADSIVSKEKGALTREIFRFKNENGRPEDIHKKAIQTAAMCIRFLKNSYQE